MAGNQWTSAGCNTQGHTAGTPGSRGGVRSGACVRGVCVCVVCRGVWGWACNSPSDRFWSIQVSICCLAVVLFGSFSSTGAFSCNSNRLEIQGFRSAKPGTCIDPHTERTMPILPTQSRSAENITTLRRGPGSLTTNMNSFLTKGRLTQRLKAKPLRKLKFIGLFVES